MNELWRTGWCLMFVVMLASCSRGTLDFMIEAPEVRQAPSKVDFEIIETSFEDALWDFGDGATSMDTSPSHTYYLSGTYDVTLTGTKGKKSRTISKQITVEAPQQCLVRIETPYGEMIAHLFDETPLHRDNFTKLVEEGFYQDLLFHRVIEGFMIQGGDPNSRGADASVQLGTGGPGYQIDAEITDQVAHVKGALAAARMGDAVNPQKKSSGSQFYIVQGRAVSSQALDQNEARYGMRYPEEVRSSYLADGGVPFLDQQYTVFGRVIKGLDVIDKLAAVATDRQDRPLESVMMRISMIK